MKIENSINKFMFFKIFIIFLFILLSNKPMNDSQKIILSKKSNGKSVDYFKPVSINIFLMDYDGRNLEQLTDNESTNVHAVYSPDGKSIIFLSNKFRKSYNGWDIFIMDLDNWNIRRLTNLDTEIGDLNWSPDSQKILFSSKHNIFTINADGSNFMQLTSSNDINELPVWSPDNKKIAFISDRGSVSSIYLMNNDGSDVKKLYKEDFSCYDKASWSLDGKKIVCQYEHGIAIVDITKERVKVLTIDEKFKKKYCGNPVWSPDGKWIVFDARDFEKDITDIYLCNVKTFKTIRISEEKWYVEPIWSSDSNKVFFFSARYENDIYSYDLKTKTITKITDGDIVDRHISVK